jgi:ubiquinol-cytochrome c reductase iron-sulfur subunit
MSVDDKVDKSRRRFLTTATSLLGGVGVAYAAVPFIGSWLPSAKTKALGAPISVDVSQLEPGAQLTVEWRGQPIWVIHRTPEMLAGLKDLDKTVRDPESQQAQQPLYAQNAYRSIKEAYLVLIGLCTHLGCVPTYRPDIGGIDAAWPGGFFCPCHGSKFDLAGRVYKGVPAPLNLPVPPHKYTQENVILIGEEEKAA